MILPANGLHLLISISGSFNSLTLFSLSTCCQILEFENDCACWWHLHDVDLVLTSPFSRLQVLLLGVWNPLQGNVRHHIFCSMKHTANGLNRWISGHWLAIYNSQNLTVENSAANSLVLYDQKDWHQRHLSRTFLRLIQEYGTFVVIIILYVGSTFFRSC